jgi:hypothetical protein
MKWTLRLDAKSAAASNYSQKVTLLPPPFASGKSDYDGKYPQIFVRVFVAGGVDQSTEYYSDFKIEAYAPIGTPPKVQAIKLYEIYQWNKTFLGEYPGNWPFLGGGKVSTPPNLKFIRGEKNGLTFGFEPKGSVITDLSMSGYKKVEILSSSTATAYLCSYQNNENFGATYFKLGDTSSTTVCVFPVTTGNISLKLSIPAEYNNGTEASEIVLNIPVVQK